MPASPPDLIRLVTDRLALNARRAASALTRRIFRNADLSRCDATCCKGGVAVSTTERDAILENRRAVADAMAESPRPGVSAVPPRDGAGWFSVREKRDPDFLAGRSCDTRVVAGGCVFLRADRLCAVHVASARVKGHEYALKPAYCILFPLCVEKGALDVCRATYTKKPDCCSQVRAGTKTPLSVFGWTIGRLRTAPARPGRPPTATLRKR